MDFGKHERQSHITQVKLAQEQCFDCCSSSHSQGSIFNDEHNSYPTLSYKE